MYACISWNLSSGVEEHFHDFKGVLEAEKHQARTARHFKYTSPIVHSSVHALTTGSNSSTPFSVSSLVPLKTPVDPYWFDGSYEFLV